MNDNWFDIFKKKVDEEMEAMTTANIMIIGKTGVGKSTLINNVFRESNGEKSPINRGSNSIAPKRSY